MDISTIEQLIKVIENSGVKEFSYKDEEMEVSISTLDHPPVIAPASGPAYVAQPAAPAAQAADEPKGDEEEYITSPIVATF